MRKQAISAIIESASKLTTEQEKINYLRNNDNTALRTILQLAFDKNIRWLVPEGTPPYKPCQYLDQDGMLYSEIRRFYLFVENERAPEMHKVRREALYIAMLESIHPNDAILVNAVKDKKLPVKGITKSIVNKAFPGLIGNE